MSNVHLQVEVESVGAVWTSKLIHLPSKSIIKIRNKDVLVTKNNKILARFVKVKSIGMYIDGEFSGMYSLKTWDIFINGVAYIGNDNSTNSYRTQYKKSYMSTW